MESESLEKSRKISHFQSENLDIDVSELKKILKTPSEFGNRIVGILEEINEALADPHLKYLMAKYSPSGGAESPKKFDTENAESEDEMEELEDDMCQNFSPEADHPPSEDLSEVKPETEETQEEINMDNDGKKSTETSFYFGRATPDSADASMDGSDIEGIRH